MADLPVPPPFMWNCLPCTRLLLDLADAAHFSADSTFHDGLARCQLMLANHLATGHPDEIPAPHENCERCAFYGKCAESQGIDDLWAEHRARDLFLPADVARLM